MPTTEFSIAGGDGVLVGDAPTVIDGVSELVPVSVAVAVRVDVAEPRTEDDPVFEASFAEGLTVPLTDADFTADPVVVVERVRVTVLLVVTLRD